MSETNAVEVQPIAAESAPADLESVLSRVEDLSRKVDTVLRFIVKVEQAFASAANTPGIPGNMLRSMLPGLAALAGN